MLNNDKSAINLLDDPAFKKFIGAFAKISKMAKKMPLEEVRKLSTAFFLPQDTVYEPVARVQTFFIAGKRQHEILLRMFTPVDLQTEATLMYFHRGGFVFGSVEEAEPVCRKLANRMGCKVIAVQYRLAPEHPFPSALEDCYEATLWTAVQGTSLDVDPSKIIVCGESAGGNLAAAVALMAKDKKQFSLLAQLLIYPALRSVIHDQSFDQCVDRYFLTKEAMKFFLNAYLPSSEDTKNRYASPILASDLTGVCPAVIVAAEYDPLHDEALEYAKALRKDDVNVIFLSFPGVIHGFLDLPIYEEAKKNEWICEIGNHLKELIA